MGSVKDEVVEKLNLPDISMSNFLKIVEIAARSRKDRLEELLSKGNTSLEELTKSSGKVGDMWNRPILGLGASGIGKTESMRGTVARKLGIGLKEVRLGSMQDSDITGLPTFGTDDAGNKITVFADLQVLPRTKSMGGSDPDYGILVLDEITTCNEQVRTVALQLLDSSRSIAAGYTLPIGWMIVALGNGPDDGGDYAGMPATIISRMTGYNITPDFDAWYEWAVQNEIHDVVVGYLAQHHEDLFVRKFQAEGSGYGVQVTNPRTWEATSDSLRYAEKYSKGSIPEGLLTPLCSSGVGFEKGVNLAAFYACKQDIIPMDKILNGEALKIPPRNIKIEALYLGQQAIVREYLRIGQLIKSSGGMKKASSTITFSNVSAAKVSSNQSDPLKPEEVKKLVNMTKFLMFCAQKVNGGLDMAIFTFDSFSKARSYSKENDIAMYLVQPNTKFKEQCPEFVEFVKANQVLINALYGSQNEAVQR